MSLSHFLTKREIWILLRPEIPGGMLRYLKEHIDGVEISLSWFYTNCVQTEETMAVAIPSEHDGSLHVKHFLFLCPSSSVSKTDHLKCRQVWKVFRIGQCSIIAVPAVISPDELRYDTSSSAEPFIDRRGMYVLAAQHVTLSC